MSNSVVLYATVSIGNQSNYGPHLACTFVSCPVFDVPSIAGVKLISQSDFAAYSLISNFQDITLCGTKTNVGSKVFPDFQWPPCSVTFINKALPPAETTTTTNPPATSTTTIGGTTTTTLPDTTTTTTAPTATTTTTAPTATTTTIAQVVVTTTTSTLPPTATTVKPPVIFVTVPTAPPVVFSSVPSIPAPTAPALVPGTTVAALIVDVAKALAPIPTALPPAPATVPLADVTPAYTGSSTGPLLATAVTLLVLGIALIRILRRHR